MRSQVKVCLILFFSHRTIKGQANTFDKYRPMQKPVFGKWTQQRLDVAYTVH